MPIENINIQLSNTLDDGSPPPFVLYHARLRLAVKAGRKCFHFRRLGWRTVCDWRLGSRCCQDGGGDGCESCTAIWKVYLAAQKPAIRARSQIAGIALEQCKDRGIGPQESAPLNGARPNLRRQPRFGRPHKNRADRRREMEAARMRKQEFAAFPELLNSP